MFRDTALFIMVTFSNYGVRSFLNMKNILRYLFGISCPAGYIVSSSKNLALLNKPIRIFEWYGIMI
jgi:hypothetical protein